jgi:hypothetical protein
MPEYLYSFSSTFNSWDRRLNWLESVSTGELFRMRLTDVLKFTISITLDEPDAHNALFERLYGYLFRAIRGTPNRQKVWSGDLLSSWAETFPSKRAFRKVLAPFLGKREYDLHKSAYITGPLLPPYKYKVIYFMTEPFRCSACGVRVLEATDKFCIHCGAQIVPDSWVLVPKEKESEPPKPPPLPDAVCDKHTYIAGLSGMGKSLLIFDRAMESIGGGYGACILDPKSDLAQLVLKHIGTAQRNKTIYLSAETPIPIHFLANTDQNRHLILQDIVGLFKRLMKDDLGSRMEPVLKWTVQALLAAGNTCFFDIYKFLSDTAFRQKILDRLDQDKDAETLQFWNVQFRDKYYHGAEAPIISRMADFLLMPPLRKVLGVANPNLTMEQIIENRMILIVDLGSFGPDGANILGCLISSQIQQVIFRRASIPESERTPFYLYADEFQSFKNESFNEIVQKARGFKLGLTLANLHPKQIVEIFDDIVGCVSTYVLFQMDGSHARMLQSKLRPVRPEALESLKPFQAYYRASDGTVTLIDTPKPPKEPEEPNAEYIRKRTMESYAQSREDPPLPPSSGGTTRDKSQDYWE